MDLYFLLRKYPVEKLLDSVEKKFGMQIGRFTLGNEFYKARNITVMPKTTVGFGAVFPLLLLTFMNTHIL